MGYRVQLLAAVLLLLFTDFGVKTSHALTSGCVNKYDEVNMPDSKCDDSTCTGGCPSGAIGGGGIGPLMDDARPAFTRPQLLYTSVEERRDPAVVTLADKPFIAVFSRFQRGSLEDRRLRTGLLCLPLYFDPRGLA